MPKAIIQPSLKPKTSKTTVFEAVLDFVHAMRTAPAYGAGEAIEWATLEQEFETRVQNEKS